MTSKASSNSALPDELTFGIELEYILWMRKDTLGALEARDPSGTLTGYEAAIRAVHQVLSEPLQAPCSTCEEQKVDFRLSLNPQRQNCKLYKLERSARVNVGPFNRSGCSG